MHCGQKRPIRQKSLTVPMGEQTFSNTNSYISASFSCKILMHLAIYEYTHVRLQHSLTLGSLKSSSSPIVHCSLALSRSLDINGSLPSVYLESNTEMSRARQHNNRKCMNKTIIINMYLYIPPLHKQPSPSQRAEMIL